MAGLRERFVAAAAAHAWTPLELDDASLDALLCETLARLPLPQESPGAHPAFEFVTVRKRAPARRSPHSSPSTDVALAAEKSNGIDASSMLYEEDAEEKGPPVPQSSRAARALRVIDSDDECDGAPVRPVKVALDFESEANLQSSCGIEDDEKSGALRGLAELEKQLDLAALSNRRKDARDAATDGENSSSVESPSSTEDCALGGDKENVSPATPPPASYQDESQLPLAVPGSARRRVLVIDSDEEEDKDENERNEKAVNDSDDGNDEDDENEDAVEREAVGQSEEEERERQDFSLHFERNGLFEMDAIEEAGESDCEDGEKDDECDEDCCDGGSCASPEPTRKPERPPLTEIIDRSQPLSPLQKAPRSARKSKGTPASQRDFTRRREEISRALFAEFNATAFEGRLPDIPVTWSKRLNKTAGVTLMRRELGQRKAAIELSTKVLDSLPKLRQTLCHEMCHAAAWILDGVSKPPHGATFKRWARTCAKRIPGIRVTTRHSYEIHYKFRYQCLNAACARVYGRHSDSIDVSRQVCGVCQSVLERLGRFNADGTPAKRRAASGFSLFVKERFAAAKAALPSAAHQDIMRALSAEFRALKIAQQPAAAATAAAAQAAEVVAAL